MSTASNSLPKPVASGSEHNFPDTMYFVPEPDSISTVPQVAEMRVRPFRKGVKLEKAISAFKFHTFMNAPSIFGLCKSKSEAWAWWQNLHESRISRAKETLARSTRRLEQIPPGLV